MKVATVEARMSVTVVICSILINTENKYYETGAIYSMTWKYLSNFKTITTYRESKILDLKM